ncbi:Uma2 family endonuclease [Nostoc sp. FACHB-152]|uniref:Uma2 family endonuclease n=1 Tax=unclassified Nostoc TaxID=2593658 RepID=UPI001688B3BD|nr:MULTISPECIES: Uma2 family endonuclease [unclassified Nostoc]MBD2447784.1 Uma2 family endonuclease [Nostoc sp. FACHB-152]MBD2467075.1 Uma2 family endonuclease [Nostoc sp. FACHB-145]
MSETTLPITLIELPPTQAELPYDDGIPMESARHKAQMDLLIDALIPWLSQREDGFVGGNMFVYYSLAQVKNKDFKGPDFFVVLGVPKGERKSWVVWEEGKAPDVVIELLSDSTAAADKNEKKLIYQNQMRVPEYFWYDPFNPDDWAGFSIQQRVYQPLVVNERNQLLSESLGLALQRWQGNYKGIDATWLRWATLEGELLPTPEEQERHYAEQESRRAEQERQRADRAESQLLQTVRNLIAGGMTVEQVANITGLDVSAIEQLRF